MSSKPTNDNFDTGFEPDEAEANDPQLPAAPTEEEFTKLKEERDSLFERFARAQADFQNSRKRLEAEADQRLQYANANLLKNLLPVIDNLERAISVDVEKSDAQSIIKGLQVL